MKKILCFVVFIFMIFLVGCFNTSSRFGYLMNVYIENTNGDKLEGEYADFFRINDYINIGSKVLKMNSAAPRYNYYVSSLKNKEDVIFVFEIKKANDYDFFSLTINETEYKKEEFNVTENNGYIYLKKSFYISETFLYNIENLKMVKDGIVNKGSTSRGNGYIKGFYIIVSKVTITEAVKELDNTINYSNNYLFSIPYKKLPEDVEIKDDLFVIDDGQFMYGFKKIDEQFYLSFISAIDWFVSRDTPIDRLQNNNILKSYTFLKEENNCVYYQKENVIITIKYVEDLQTIDYVCLEVIYE